MLSYRPGADGPGAVAHVAAKDTPEAVGLK